MVAPERIVVSALRLRVALGHGVRAPVCPFDIAAAVGVRVHCFSTPSLEGLYRPGEPATIIVGAQRPFGRRNFTCAHELGHHVHGHGYQVDEVTDTRSGRRRAPEEYVADRFAAALLMPKLCVLDGFTCRGVDPSRPTPDTVAIVADELGVGYGTLIGYMAGTLSLLGEAEEKQLRSMTPKRRKEALVGAPTDGRLVLVDRHWRRAFVDLEVGDILVVPSGGRVEGDCLLLRDGCGTYEARRPGCTRVNLPGRDDALQARVSRRWFHGLARYRFLEDPDGG
jgi:Zn-dependent peptidase ImmA (M78 family)